LYGVEDSGSVHALVMELVDGEDLSTRLTRGALPVGDALRVARQIAEALEAAHEQGIIHRDLKPANVKIRDDGTVKVLDFGLAKALAPAGGSGSAIQDSPTLTARVTQMGVILGTAAYMSPEQARGKAVDRRTDVWAFGIVLYEMLAGRRAFEGDEVSDVLAAVLKETPSLVALPHDTPEPIRRLLARCLAKDRRERLADMSAARLEINDALNEAPVRHRVVDARRRWLDPVIIGSAVLLAGIGVAAGWLLRPTTTPAPPPVVHFSVPLDAGMDFTRPRRHSVAISPDGKSLAYIAGEKLFVRFLEEDQGAVVAGASDPAEVFFSPDSKWIGFFADGKIQKVAVTGGAPVPVCDATVALGASWSGDGDVIVYGQPTGLFRVPASGGVPELLIARRTDVLSNPSLLPGGRVLMFSRIGSADLTQEIAVEDLSTHTRRVLVSGGGDARYLPGGYLVYGHLGTLLAQRMDLETLQLSGTPVQVLSGIWELTGGAVTGGTGSSQFSLSNTGTLAYVPGGLPGSSKLAWIDFEGHQQPVLPDTGGFAFPRVSPHGTHIAFSDQRAGNADVFVLEWARGATTRLTTDTAADTAPIWTADGKRIAFNSFRDGSANVYWQSADGSGTAERLTSGSNPQYPFDWTSDGETLLYMEQAPRTAFDIYAVSIRGDRKPRPLVATAYDEKRPALSPDGRWLAYQSNEQGTIEVFVRPYPDTDRARYQISAGGGSSPLWSPEGRALFYRQSGKIFRVEVTTGSEVKPGIPKQVADRLPVADTTAMNYALTPDGKRFVVVVPASAGAQTSEIRVVLNWREELERRLSR
jgi:serine/threonine-protein kinase